MKDLNKASERAVIGSFHLRREGTGGKLARLQVIGNTFTALALSGAGLIGTGATGFIRFNIAFHNTPFRQNELFVG